MLMMNETNVDEHHAHSLSIEDTHGRGPRESEVVALMNAEIPRKLSVFDYGVLTGITLSLFASIYVLIIGALQTDYSLLICFGLSTYLAVTAGYQRLNLQDMASLREVHDEIRESIFGFQSANQELTANVDGVERESDRLKKFEVALDDVLESSGKNATSFMETVKENQKVLDAIKANIQGKIVQDLLGVVLTSDRDGDHMIDPEEMNEFIMRLNMFQGVTFDVERFKNEMKSKGYGLSAVMDIIDNIIDDTVADKIFKIDPSCRTLS